MTMQSILGHVLRNVIFEKQNFLERIAFSFIRIEKKSMTISFFTAYVFTTPSFSCPFPRKSYYKDKPLIIIECSKMFAIDVMSNHSCCKWYEKWYKSGL